MLAGRSLERLERLAQELGSASALAVDVRDAGAVAERVAEAHARLGGLDVVVNAAAIDTGWAKAGEMSLEIWDDTIATNLSGTYYVCRAALPLMGEGGSIVNITSVAGLRAWAEDAAYNASKAGVELLTRTIAVEYATLGIRANCLAPGVIDGGLTDVVTSDAERAAARCDASGGTHGPHRGGGRGSRLARLGRLVVHDRIDAARGRRLPRVVR